MYKQFCTMSTFYSSCQRFIAGTVIARKRRFFLSNTKASSHSKANKSTHVSVIAQISSDTASATDNELIRYRFCHVLLLWNHHRFCRPSRASKVHDRQHTNRRTCMYSMLITCLSSCLASRVTICRPKHSDIAMRQWCGGQRDTECLVVGDCDL